MQVFVENDEKLIFCDNIKRKNRQNCFILTKTTKTCIYLRNIKVYMLFYTITQYAYDLHQK